MYRRQSSRRRAPYTPKPVGVRWLAEVARKEDAERPEWMAVYGDRTVEDIALERLRMWVLAQCNGVKTQAAEILGISVRSLSIHVKRYESLGVEIPVTRSEQYRIPMSRTFWNELQDRLFFLGFNDQ